MESTVVNPANVAGSVSANMIIKQVRTHMRPRGNVRMLQNKVVE